MAKEPLASGVIVPLPRARRDELASLARETAAMLKALQAEALVADRVAPESDYAVLLVESPFSATAAPLPDLRDRCGVAIAIADDDGEGRVAVTAARKHLRSAGAVLGARELVLTGAHFGVMGLEDDAAREKLEIMLRTLVVDAERLRLKREGWEEPETREHL